jgi:predicted Zn-dependent peptidase
MLSKVVLKNGLQVVFVSNERSIAFAMSVFVPVGSFLDPKNKEGLAHFVEHMTFRKTKLYKNDNDILSAIGAIGAKRDGGTDRLTTSFNIRCGILKAEDCIKIVSEMVLRPVMTQEDFERERGEIMAEIAINSSDSDSVIVEQADAFYFSGNPLACDLFGTNHSLANITLSDVAHWHAKHYRPDNMLIAVSCHKSNKQQIIKWIEQYFSDGSEEASFPKGSLINIPQTGFVFSEKKENCLVVPDKSSEGILRLVLPGLPFRSDQGLAMWVLANLFGGEDCSLMVKKLRMQLGITHSFLCFPYSYTDCGLFIVHVPASADNIENVFSEIAILMRDFSSIITDEDVKIAKQITITNLYLLMDDVSVKLTDFFGRMALFGVDWPLDRFINEIESLTKEDILALAENVFSKQMTITVLGPYEPVKTKKRLLKIYKNINEKKS